jgi:hypothetical protein
LNGFYSTLTVAQGAAHWNRARTYRQPFARADNLDCWTPLPSLLANAIVRKTHWQSLLCLQSRNHDIDDW